MANYATCFNCAVDKATCQRRADLRATLKGANVYTVKFKCADRQPMFSTGQRVEFDWSSWETDDYDSSELPLVFHGTVICERGSKFIVQVDAGKDASGEEMEASDVFKNENLLIKVRPANMRGIDEPSKAVCPTCYHIEGSAEARCYKSAGQVWVPDGCLQPAMKREDFA